MRSFECDAFAVSPDGWGYLVEVKAWLGTIHGNDSQWELPSLSGGPSVYRPNPVQLVHTKTQILSDQLRNENPQLRKVFIQPLLVLVSDLAPQLEGRCAANSVLIAQMVERIQTDPRNYLTKPPVDAPELIVEILGKTSKAMAPETIVGSYQLLELVEVNSRWEVWAAKLRMGGPEAAQVRLKRYRLDSLVTGADAEKQKVLVRRDLVALERLAGARGALQVQGVDEIDDSFVVVTQWPSGESLASLLANGPLEASAAEEVFDALCAALASIHHENVVHRNLRPECAHFLDDGRVVITDFDYARLPGLSGQVTRISDEELTTKFLAPEVIEESAQASKRSDVFSLARIGLALFGVNEKSALSAMPTNWRPIISRAISANPQERARDAEGLLEELNHGEAEPLFHGFHAYDEINDRYVVQPHGAAEGGLARVYKVEDSLTSDIYAAKFTKAEAAVGPESEWEILKNVPLHHGVVKPVYLERMERFRRNRKAYAHKQTFLVSPWIEGTSLDRLITERLSQARCAQIVMALAEAIGHLHRHNVYHRDVKPANVIVDESGRPQLVDFNVSSGDEAAVTETGTPPYRPPDFPNEQWGAHSDTYAATVILCELLAGETLGSKANAWAIEESRLPDSLKGVLTKGTDPKRKKRFDHAGELAEALFPVVKELERPLVSGGALAPFPEASPEELARSDWNPYLYQLVRLFSQSSVSNAGTRGLDDFGRWTYVKTAIDEQFVADLVEGRYRLAIITGNAGDGKTAFIQMTESQLQLQGGELSVKSNGNGAQIELGRRTFHTNWDGSQDEGDQNNDEVLRAFFGPLAGLDPSPPALETRILAINEGRLMDFLHSHAGEFQWLQKAYEAYARGEFVEDERLCFVNLNLRALTLPDQESLVAKILGQFADPRLWEPCKGCVAYNLCYARSNAAALRDPVLGPRVSERIRQTLDLTRLRRRLHITMRDLRSALAFIVAGNRACGEIVQLVSQNDVRSLLAGNIFNSLFAASHALESPFYSDDASRDRLLRLIGSLDVARTAEPEIDSKLWLEGAEVFPSETTGSRGDRLLIGELKKWLPSSPAELALPLSRMAVRSYQVSLRRKLYLEREDPRWVAMLPYQRLVQFLDLLESSTEADRDQIVTAISNSEGLYSPQFKSRLAVRLVGDSEGAHRAFRLEPAEHFELNPVDHSKSAGYVEYRPDRIRLSHIERREVHLDIDLDLFETLMRILDGFTPSRAELRGAWLNLRIFKDAVARMPSDSLVVTSDDKRFHQISRVPAQAMIEARESTR